MKKLLAVFLALFVAVSCSKSADTFKGKMYKLTTSPSDMNITLGFDENENRFFGKALNNYFGSYSIDGNEMIFGAIGTTMMAGPENMMQAESNYLAALPNVNGYSLSGKKLVLKTSAGEELIFEETGPVSE